MAKNEIVPQYYNLYDDTKGYTELLFRAGKVLQSKELNELQSILKNQIKNVGNTILTNGDIIEGCQLVISDDHTTVTMTKGRIYLDGDVREVPDTVLNITGIGTEVIGAILQTEVITPDEDADLADIATGYDNYNQDGAYRLKETVKITLNNPNASILYNLINGEQLTVNKSEDLTQLDKINATLARRTYEESGNYKVSGLTLSDKQQNDTDYIYLTLEAGKAYVRGYEVNKDVAYTVRLDRASNLRNVENEPKTFKTGTLQYALNNTYVNSIKKIVAEVEVTGNITRGSIIGGTDYLPLSPVRRIMSVSANGVTYEEGVDFTLESEGINWSIGSKAPGTNSTYQVTWTYNKNLLKEVDYTLGHNDDWSKGYVNFTASGDKPVNGTTFTVNYDFMLYRRDVIGLDKNGNVIITKGQSDILRNVESPSVDSDHILALGSVLLTPKSNAVSIINNNTKTIRMLELYNMLERINDLEYNQAITSLDQEAAEEENATQLHGIFTDGFIGLTKADIGHAEWSAAIDLDNQELTLPYTTTVTPLMPDTTINYRAGTFRRLLTNAYSTINLLSQPLASGSIRINSYNAFPKTPSLKLSPEVDNWIDEETVEIQGATTSKTVTLRRWWLNKNASWAQAEKALWQSYGFADGGAYISTSTAYNSRTAGTTNLTQSSIESIVKEAIMYMRQKRIDIAVQNLESNVDNVVATFNGTAVSLSPTQAQYQGSTVGTLKADSSGNAYGYFTVPANTLCGTVEVNAYAQNTPSLAGSANYTANGNKETTTKKVWTEKVTVKAAAYDPLAQSFMFEQDQFLTGIGLYFLDKDLIEPITVQVRNMVNGYPGTIVYAEKVVAPASVRTSQTSLEETQIIFDDPVYCNGGEQYCFTILSNSDIDSLWVAETTKLDTNTNSLISKNPYINGMLFSSSNALTWTAHQSQDLKFNLYGAKFEINGQVTFQGISGANIDRIMVMSEESIPTGCSVQWQYSVNGTEWLPIETYDDRELEELAESIQLRCSLTGNTTTSPAIALDSLILCGFTNEKSSVYVSKNFPVTNGFNHVKAIMDMHLPTGSNAIISYATDISGTNWKPFANTSTIQKSVGAISYNTYTFEDTLSEVAYNYRIKIELTTIVETIRPRVQNLKNIMKTI